ncbi:class I SAM-dependent methyltransferase [Bradyrhizobium sp. SYSU BS000235]|uniref:class I SAM-dependent methyltransferase n=1 Tax=Bradyrhizobium sp. SYSU BS000235 TaxID=3411332 RepID=UPI003C72CF6C
MQGNPRDPARTPAEDAALLAYLRSLYTGVFPEDSIKAHIDDYVGLTFADQVLPTVAGAVPAGGRVLDIGCGFGGFVLAARVLGLDAYGIEIAPFEVEFARQRLSRAQPQDDAKVVYRQGDALALVAEEGTFDAITLWNVLEHIGDGDALLTLAARLLKPGGVIFIICPNYAAFRDEAHYQVPWYPLFPRYLASGYLRRQGRDPSYFETSIFYRTNWGVMRALRRAGFELYDFSATTSMAVTPRHALTMLRHPKIYFRYYNPMKESVVLAARKKVRS